MTSKRVPIRPPKKHKADWYERIKRAREAQELGRKLQENRLAATTKRNWHE